MSMSESTDDDPGISHRTTPAPDPLTTLCIQQIFRSADLPELDHILGSCCPPGLFPDLMCTVLLAPCASPIAIRTVLKHWPDRTFRMSEIRVGVAGDKSGRSCSLTTTAILRAFLDALGHVTCAKLRVLDLRGFELGDMDFLKNYKGLLLDPHLSKTGCQIYMDLNITYANDYLMWNEILPRVQGVIKVAKLSTIFRTGFDSTKLILDALDEQVLTSLVAKHLEMINEEFTLLVDSISRLRQLTELDLSCGTLRLSEARNLDDERNSGAVEGLAHVLLCLPKLTTLNLSNNKLGANVGTFFGESEFTLEKLALKNCGLLPCDIDFMNRSCDKFSSLDSLDLGDNNMSEDLSTLIRFLGTLVKLRILCLEECCLKESQVRPLCDVVKSNLRHLTELNLSGHKWGKVTLLECVHALVPRPSLHCLVLPIYGIGSLQFKFKAGRFHGEGGAGRPPLSQVLEPVAGQSSEVEEIRKAVESYRDKRNGFKSMVFKINWLDGMAFTFTKH